MSSVDKESIATLLERVVDLEQSIYGKLDSLRDVSLRPGAATPAHRQLANPAPLGLLGFAAVSFLSGVLKISPDGAAAFDGAFSATAFFLGGMSQVLACIFSLIRNHTHAATAFGVYGFHWMTTGLLFFVRSLDSPSFVAASYPATAVTYNLVLVAVTVVLWIPSFRLNLVLNATFVAIGLVFTLDIPSVYGSRAAQIASGICQCGAGGLGLYAALLDLVNEAWRKPVLPLFPHKEHKNDYRTGEGVIPYVPRRTYHKSAMSSIHL